MRVLACSFLAVAACSCLGARGQDATWNALPPREDDANLATVGIKHPEPLCDKNGEGLGCAVGANVLAALELDAHLTVTAVEMGDMICENLEDAETAERLKFTLSSKQVVVANRKSFHTVDENVFSDNLARKVWTGEVEDDSTPEGALPTTVSITWSGCEIETFLVKIITPTPGGGTSTTTSIPCDPEAGTKKLCVLEMYREGVDESDEPLDFDDDDQTADEGNRRLGLGRPKKVAGAKRGPRVMWTQAKQQQKRDLLAKEAAEGIARAKLEDPDIDAKDNDIRLLSEYQSANPLEKEVFHAMGVRRLSEGQVSMPSGRVLQDTPTIDVMVVYTKKAMFESNSADGSVRSNAQMETDIITAYEGANNALADSGVDFRIRVVHMAEIDFTEGPDISDAVYELFRGDHPELKVHEKRDEYGADLVQMVGFYDTTCGIGFTMQTPSSGFSKYGYSVVHTSCLSNFSHIHELGHNLGANHDNDNTETSHDYAHAYRFCEGENPFRTIMAYESGCKGAPRVNVFSSPRHTFNGHPQGTEHADNARVLNEAMATVINFREAKASASQPTPDPPGPAPSPANTPAAKGSSGKEAGAQETGEVSIYPVGNVTGMKRKGCFRDEKNDRVMRVGTKMPAIPDETIGMKRENCMAYCTSKSKPYKYFGVEYGEECFCSNSKKKFKRKGRLTSADCDMECPGDPNVSCGGRDAIEVFRIGDLGQDKETSTSSYQGCYYDSMFDLEMVNEPVVDHEATSHEACNDHCEAAGYSYFGLEFGYQCSCGNSVPVDRLKGEDDLCDLPCTDAESKQNCGGNGHMAVFSVDDE